MDNINPLFDIPDTDCTPKISPTSRGYFVDKIRQNEMEQQEEISKIIETQNLYFNMPNFELTEDAIYQYTKSQIIDNICRCRGSMINLYNSISLKPDSKYGEMKKELEKIINELESSISRMRD